MHQPLHIGLASGGLGGGVAGLILRSLAEASGTALSPPDPCICPAPWDFEVNLTRLSEPDTEAPTGIILPFQVSFLLSSTLPFFVIDFEGIIYSSIFSVIDFEGSILSSMFSIIGF